MRKDGERAVFESTGASIPYPPGGAFGITSSGKLVTGYDAPLEVVFDLDDDKQNGEERPLLTEERQELAAAMIRRWASFGSINLQAILALSVRQPFASAIGAGVKLWENRSNAGPRSPCWMAIHAGRDLYKFEPGSIVIRGMDPQIAPLEQLRTAWPDMPSIESMPRGGYLALAHYIGSFPWSEARYHGNLWAWGPVVWEFDQVIKLPALRPARGQLMPWRPDPADLAEFAALLLENGVNS